MAVDLTIRIGANSLLFRKELAKVEREVLKRNKFLDTLDRQQKAVFLARERKLQLQRQALIRATTVAFIAAIAGGAAAIKVFADFETQLVATGRTTGLAGKELEDFGENLKVVSEELGRSRVGLLKITEVAGTLGIKGSENLMKFTKAMALFDIASATLQGAEAAKQIARIISLTGGGVENVERYASEIAFLADNMNATEATIVEVAKEISSVNALFKLGTLDTIDFAAALASFGITGEIARTSIAKFSEALDKGLREGGEELRIFMKLTGMTRDELKKNFEDDPIEIFKAFSKGLAKTGGDARFVLSKLRLNQARLAKTFLIMAQNSDVLEFALDRQSNEMERANKLQNEAAKALATTEARFNKSKEAIRNMGIELGSFLAPAVVAFSELTVKRLKQITAGFEGVGVIIKGLGTIAEESFNFILLQLAIFDRAIAGVFARSTLALQDFLNKIPGVDVDLTAGIDIGNLARLDEEIAARSERFKEFFLPPEEDVIRDRFDQVLSAHGDFFQELEELRAESLEQQKEEGTLDIFGMGDDEFQETLEQFADRLQSMTDIEKEAIKKRLDNAKTGVDKRKIFEDQIVQAKTARFKAEEQLDQAISNSALESLQTIVGNSKAAQIAIFLIQKAMAVARTLAAAQEAGLLAFGSQFVMGDPSSLARAEAARQFAITTGTIQAAIIGATAIPNLVGMITAQDGGVVPGGFGGGDRVPALLEPGELIIPQRFNPLSPNFEDTFGGGGGGVRVEIGLTDEASQFITVGQREDTTLGVQR